MRAVVRDAGTLYLGGAFTKVGPASGHGVPLNATSGALASSYAIVDGAVTAVAADGAGGWFVGGSFGTVGGLARSNVAHVLADGSVAAWNPGVDGAVNALAIRGGQVYVGGEFTHAGGFTRNRIAAIDASSGAVSSWNPNASAEVRALAVSGNKVYVAGGFDQVGGAVRNQIAVLDGTTGAAIPGWNPDAASASVHALSLGNGVVYAAGQFTQIGGQARNYIAALDTVTGSATSWNPTATSIVRCVVANGPVVYIGGNFGVVDSQSRVFLAAIDASSGHVTAWNPSPNGTVQALAVNGTTVYVAGAFTSIAGQVRDGIAALSASTGAATAFDPDADGTVRALAVDAVTLFAGGDFTSIGRVARNRVAALDATTGAATAWDPSADGPVTALLVRGQSVYAGGAFASIGGRTRSCLAQLDRTTGGASATWNPGPDGAVLALDWRLGRVYAGGSFTHVAGANHVHFAAIDSTTGVPAAWDAGANNGSVNTIAATDAVVYVGGDFTAIGGQARGRVAALDPATGLATSWNPGADGTVRALLLSGATLYAGGGFTQVGGQHREYVAALDPASGVAAAWNPGPTGGTPEASYVGALATLNGVVYAGGSFVTMGGASRHCVAAVDSASGVALAWNPDAAGVVNTIDAIAPAAAAVAIAGDFATLAGQSLANVAEAFAPPFVDQVTPSVGGDAAPRTVSVTGAGFRAAIDVRLVRSGWPDIVANPVDVAADSRSLSARFDLLGAAIGTWDLVVTNADGQTVTRPAAFTVAPIGWKPGGDVVPAPGVMSAPLVIDDGSAGCLVVWQGVTGADADVYAQRLTAAGAVAMGWPAGGAALCSHAGNQYLRAAVSDGRGGAIVAWVDERDSLANGGNVYVQRIRANAQVAWPADGIPVEANGAPQLDVVLCPDVAAGCIASWIDRRSPTALLFAQRIDSSGVRRWSAATRVAARTSWQTQPAIAADGTGGAFVAWADSVTDAPEVRLQRFDAGGTVQFGPDGLLVSDPGTPSDHPTIISLNSVIAWLGHGSGALLETGGPRATSSHDGVFARRVTTTGLAWSGSVTVCDGPSGAREHPTIISDLAGGAIVGWTDTRNGAADVYVQRVRDDGTVAWATNGIAATTAPGDQMQPRLASDGASGAFVLWQDDRAGDLDVYAQRLKLDGTRPAGWAADGIAVCQVGGDQRDAVVIADGAGGMVAAWQDGRADTTKVFATRIGPDAQAPLGVAAPPRPRVDTGLRLSAARPNPTRGGATAELVLGSAALVRADVFDVVGRQVARLVAPEWRTAGSYTLHWNGRDDRGRPAPAGVYFVCVSAGDRVARRALVRLR